MFEMLTVSLTFLMGTAFSICHTQTHAGRNKTCLVTCYTDLYLQSDIINSNSFA